VIVDTSGQVAFPFSPTRMTFMPAFEISAGKEAESKKPIPPGCVAIEEIISADVLQRLMLAHLPAASNLVWKNTPDAC
jgi:hypothetical protein